MTDLTVWNIDLDKDRAALLYEALSKTAIAAPQAKVMAQLWNDVETAAIMTGAIPKPDEKV